MTPIAWIVLAWVALAAIHVARRAVAAFDAPPKKRREDYGERDDREPVIPMVGSRFVESTQVKRTEAGSTITVLHLTPEGRRALSTTEDK